MSKKSKLLLNKKNDNKEQAVISSQENSTPTPKVDKKNEQLIALPQEQTPPALELDNTQAIYPDSDLLMKINSIYEMLSSGSASASSTDNSTEIKISNNLTEKSSCSEEKKYNITNIFRDQKALSYIYQNYLEITALAHGAQTSKEHVSQQRSLAKNKEVEFSSSALRTLKAILDQNEKTEKEYLRLQITTKKLLTSTLALRVSQENLIDISKKVKEDCTSETCFDESDFIRNVCGALKYGHFFEDLDS